ncbi:hypothetical protein ES703_119507 [subsurface metagenome]
MTEPKTAEELKAELARSVTICGCHGTIVTTADGKEHAELVCPSKEARDKAAAILEEEVILRVKPKMPVVEPVIEGPEPEPVTES